MRLTTTTASRPANWLCLYSIRSYSTKARSTKASATLTNQDAREWLSSLDVSKLPPANYFNISYARSSGPGGQNVNKVSTKATVKLDKAAWETASWIPEQVRQQLLSTGSGSSSSGGGNSAAFPYQVKSGGIVIQSDRTRSRETNLADCFEKLVLAIKQSAYFPPDLDETDIKRWDSIMKKSNEKRLQEKKIRGQKKQSRTKNFDD